MMNSIYSQSLPSTQASSAIVSGWAQRVARAERPLLARRAQATAQILVDHVVRNVSPYRQLHVEVEITAYGLRITVRVPSTAAYTGALELGELADPLISVGWSGGVAGLEGWAELRNGPLATACPS